MVLGAGADSCRPIKCQEGARTVITDRPCIGGETMKVKPASGDYGPSVGASPTERL